MAPNYKLLYFNVTGLGEPIRYLLAYGKISYEDKRFEFPEWEQYKPSTPFGKVPVLEIDGKQAAQSTAISRYLAKKVGLVGKTDDDALDADIIVDTITDLRTEYTGFFREKDETAKAAKLEQITTKENPFYLSRLEKIAKENGGHFVSGQLTWADVFFAAITEMMGKMLKDPNFLDQYPTLKALKEKVENLPGIKEHRAARPDTFI